MKNVSVFSLFAFVLFFSACKEKQTATPVEKEGIVVVNEGNFGWGNADLSVYNLQTGEITNDVFQTANYPLLLGDVAQCAIVRDSLVYVVLNNSAKIEVLSRANFKRKETINVAGSSPRYLLFLNDSIALVSELYANKIWKLNVRTGETFGSISALGETDQMLLANDNIFVIERTVLGGSFTAGIRVINAQTLTTTQVVSLPSEPNSFALDNENNLFVLTDSNAHCKATLSKINTTNLAIVKQDTFASGQPNLLRANTAKTALFFALNKAIFKMATTAEIPNTPFIQAAMTLPYGMNINPANDDIFVADAIDYTQPSKCFVYDASGNLKTSFRTGMITNAFVF